MKLKVVHSVNESYELKIQTTWGTETEVVNPYEVIEGDYITEIFHFIKHPNHIFKIQNIFADGKKLECNLINKYNEYSGFPFRFEKAVIEEADDKLKEAFIEYIKNFKL